MKKLIKGFNQKCSNEEYHADREYKSSSALKMILKNPREYHKTYVMNERKENNSPALIIGSYAHTRILEPELVEVEYAVYLEGQRRGKKWEEFKALNEGKAILVASQKSLVDSMVSEYEKSSVILGNHGNEKEVLISTFFSEGKAEETLCGEIDGYKVKCRFDYRKEFEDFASINDLKTTNIALGSASVKDIEDICEYWGYHISAALYADLAEKETGLPHDFFFIFLSKVDYSCRIFKASAGMIERGRKDYKAAIVALKEAEKTGVFFKNTIPELR